MKSNIEFLYEELRKATDGGSESMTHDDALKQIEYWRGLYQEVEALRADAARMTWLLSPESDACTAPSKTKRELILAAWEAITDCGENYTSEQKRKAIDAAIAAEATK